ncbi:MAG: THUMP domain-containing protein [Candidatus Nitrosocaldus sp.]
MAVVVVEPTLSASSRLDTLRANIMGTLDIHGIKCSIEQDGHLLILDAKEPVDAMYALEHVFGVESICIADRAEKGLNPLVDAIVRIGKDIMHRNERFHVEVEVLGSTKGIVARDVEFAATAALLSELSSLDVKPSSKDDGYDRLIRVYISGENSYVCRLCMDGSGGLPVGSNGYALCSVYDCISAVAAYVLAEHGFYPSIIVVYTDDEMLRRVVKKIEVIARMLSRKRIELRYTYYTPNGKDDDGGGGSGDAVSCSDCSDKHYTTTVVSSLLLDRLVGVSDMGSSSNSSSSSSVIALPLSSSLHSMDFINSVMRGMSYKNIMLPLMFSNNNNLLHYSKIFGMDCVREIQAIMSKFGESRVVDDDNYEHVNEYVEECINNMHTLEVSLGPNMVHDIIDGIRHGW